MMTRETIEAELDRPEHRKPLEELAKARIACELTIDRHHSATGGDSGEDFRESVLGGLDDRENDFIDNMALVFEETRDVEDTPAEIIKAYYEDILKTYRSSEYRRKEAMKEAAK